MSIYINSSIIKITRLFEYTHREQPQILDQEHKSEATMKRINNQITTTNRTIYYQIKLNQNKKKTHLQRSKKVQRRSSTDGGAHAVVQHGRCSSFRRYNNGWDVSSTAYGSGWMACSGMVGWQQKERGNG